MLAPPYDRTSPPAVAGMAATVSAVLILIWLAALQLVPGAAAEQFQAQPAASQPLPPIRLSQMQDGRQLFGRAEFFRSPDKTLGLPAVLAAPGWRVATAKNRNQGITDDAFWLRFTLDNDTDAPRRVTFTHFIAYLTDVDTYVLEPDGAVSEVVYDYLTPASQRTLQFAGPATAIELPAQSEREVVVRFSNEFAVPMDIGLSLWSDVGFQNYSIRYTAFYAFWTACLLMLALFWTLYGAIMGHRRMIYYALYMSGLAYSYAGLSGIGSQLLFPGTEWLHLIGYHWSMFLAVGAALEFSRRHLALESRQPLHNRICVYGRRLSFVLMVASIVFIRPGFFAPLTFVLLTAAPIYIAWLSFIAWWRDGIGYASWMVFGWTTISVCTIFAIFGSGLSETVRMFSPVDLMRVVFVAAVLEGLLLNMSLAQWLRGQQVQLAEAEDAAARDSLTRLLNRRGLGRAIERLKTEPDWPSRYWLALLDIDRFKAINDTSSHMAGDAVLLALANLLRQECRSGDVIARFGGEEFVMLFGAASADDAYRLLERIRTEFERTPTRFANTSIAHTLSAGLVRVADFAGTDDTAMLAAADDALYTAKRSGRNRVFFRQPALPGMAHPAGQRHGESRVIG